MGLIRALSGAASGVLADQWKEYFYCDSLPDNVLVRKARHRVSGRSSNTSGGDNIITNGSVIAVADGQCMILVDQGKVTELCAEPGEFTYNSSTEPSVFYGGLGKGIVDSFKNIGKRFTFGGEAPKDQRVYYVNTKELLGSKYGTPSPVPFRVVDERAGIDIDISIQCFGEYSYHICDPILFYTNVCGNVSSDYTRDCIDGQLRSELLTSLQPAFAKISALGIRYSALPGHTTEIANALNEVLSEQWKKRRGIEIVSFGVSSVKATADDEKMLKDLQHDAAFRDPTLAAAHLVGAQGEAMKAAAANKNAGPAMAFMGMNMAGQAGGLNAQQLYQMGAQQQAAQQMAQKAKEQSGKDQEDRWDCPKCGAKGVQGKYCPDCGTPRPSEAWVCPKCGASNTSKFCSECGTPRPAAKPKYRCSNCGWEPDDPENPPKFCPECGNQFGQEDIVS